MINETRRKRALGLSGEKLRLWTMEIYGHGLLRVLTPIKISLGDETIIFHYAAGGPLEITRWIIKDDLGWVVEMVDEKIKVGRDMVFRPRYRVYGTY